MSEISLETLAIAKKYTDEHSGGSSGDDNDLLVVKITEDTSDGATTYTFSHTPAEVYSWITANKPAIAVMNGVIGKVYLGAYSDVICAIPKHPAIYNGGAAIRGTDGLTATGFGNGTEWSTGYSPLIFGADEVLSGGTGEYAIIWDGRDGAPQYQQINKNYTFGGALYQLVSGAMLAANPEAALSTVFESTAPEFNELIDVIGSIYDAFVTNGRGIMFQGIVDRDNHDSWLVKNVAAYDSGIDITADACFTTFSNSSPSSVSMITLTIAELRNASQEPEKVAVTAICKTINTTVV